MSDPTSNALKIVSTGVSVLQLVDLIASISLRVKEAMQNGQTEVPRADIQASLASLDEALASLDAGIAQRQAEEAAKKGSIPG